MRLMQWQTARLVITHTAASVIVIAGMIVAGVVACLGLLAWTLAAGSGGYALAVKRLESKA